MSLFFIHDLINIVLFNIDLTGKKRQLLIIIVYKIKNNSISVTGTFKPSELILVSILRI
jgi:hypothetical protein